MVQLVVLKEGAKGASIEGVAVGTLITMPAPLAPTYVKQGFACYYSDYRSDMLPKPEKRTADAKAKPAKKEAMVTK